MRYFLFKRKRVFVANYKGMDVRLNSSSGGAFYAIASYVLTQGGIVVGAAYKGTDVEHIAITDKSDLWMLQKSKYAPSSLKYLDMDQLLSTGKLLLFSGTPCQVKVMHQRYGAFKNLILLEIACHGVPTKKTYDDYIRENDIVKIDFRCKKKGWKNNMIEITKSDGSVVCEDAKDNKYYQQFLSGEIIRKSCFTCQSKYFSSGADFTLADAWGINDFASDLDDNKGSSIVILHSLISNEIWNGIKDIFCYKKISLADAIRYNHSIIRPNNSKPLILERLDALWIVQVAKMLFTKFKL